MSSSIDFYDIVIIGTVLFLSAGYLLTKSTSTALSKASSTSTSTPIAAATATTKRKSRSLISKLEGLKHEKMAVLFFGSQTGTAEDLAIRTQNDISSMLSIPAVVLDTDDFEMEELSQWKDFDASRKWLVGFFMATYGEGEPTDNSADFYSWVMDGMGTVADKGDQDDQMVEDKICEGMSYFIFGLGNKTYEHYNAIARRLDGRLTKIGAIRVGRRGEGNDDESIEEDYLNWIPTQLKAIGQYFGVAVDVSSQNKPHIPLFNSLYLDSHEAPFSGEITAKNVRKWQHVAKTEYEEIKPAKNFDAKHPYYSHVKTSKTLFIDANDVQKFQSDPIQIKSKRIQVQGDQVIIPRQCYHMEFDLASSGLSYKTGDHLGVWANNDAGQVEKLLNLLKVEKPDSLVKLLPNPENSVAANTKIPYPLPCTVRDAFTYYLDILTPLKQHHFLILAKYASKEEEKVRLLQLSEKREEFVSLVENGQKSLSCALEDFSSVKIPLGVVLGELLRPATVRYYSISSSSLESPKVVSVTAVVVRYALPQSHLKLSGKKRVISKEGFATSCLERLHEHRMTNPTTDDSNGKVPKLYLPVYIRSSSFRLPKDHLKPVVMVGPGTGVAPFRGFLRERVLVASQGTPVGPTWLFFGSRNEKSDNLYADEFADLLQQVKEKGLQIDLRIFTAFSRDTSQKVYVQHRLAENGAQVWSNLQAGYFYICGDAKRMAADVNQTLKDIAVQHGSLTEASTKTWIKNLRSSNRYLEDVWS